jgi:hypothetical protein
MVTAHWDFGQETGLGQTLKVDEKRNGRRNPGCNTWGIGSIHSLDELKNENKKLS